MTIIAPESPEFAIRIVDGDRVISVTNHVFKHGEAMRLLRRIRDTFPASTLGFYNDYEGWKEIDDEQTNRIVYRHTMQVAQALTDASLPMAHWSLAPNGPDQLVAMLHTRSQVEARAGLVAFAKVLGVDEDAISESWSEYGLHLDLPETVWAGVHVAVRAYVPRHALPACVECDTFQGVAQQRDHRSDELVWLCEPCHRAGAGASDEQQLVGGV